MKLVMVTLKACNERVDAIDFKREIFWQILRLMLCALGSNCVHSWQMHRREGNMHKIPP